MESLREDLLWFAVHVGGEDPTRMARRVHGLNASQVHRAVGAVKLASRLRVLVNDLGLGTVAEMLQYESPLTQDYRDMTDSPDHDEWFSLGW